MAPRSIDRVGAGRRARLEIGTALLGLSFSLFSSPFGSALSAQSSTTGSNPGALATACPDDASRGVLAAIGLVPSEVEHRGKILMRRTATGIAACTAMHPAFRLWPVSSQAIVRLSNDLLVVLDGDQAVGFGALGGVFRSCPTVFTVNATIVNPANQVNDGIVLIRDGSALWSFAGLPGRWTHRPISGADRGGA